MHLHMVTWYSEDENISVDLDRLSSKGWEVVTAWATGGHNKDQWGNALDVGTGVLLRRPVEPDKEDTDAQA